MFWQTRPQQLSRSKIKDALLEILKINEKLSQYYLRFQLTCLIGERFFALLNRNVSDTPEYLEKLLKAVINTIYLENRSLKNYSANIVCDKEDTAFTQALESYNASPVKNDALFESCLLTTVPEDGRVFLIDDNYLKPLQDLAKKCGIELIKAWKVEEMQQSKPAASMSKS